MNKILIMIFISLYSACLFTQEKAGNLTTRIQGSKELPLELNLLIESLQNSISLDKILPYVLNIDSYAMALSKEDIFLIGKVEIYKTLLKSNVFSLKALVDGSSTKILASAIKKAQDPFVSWFLQALLRDSEALMRNPNYKEYVLQKRNGPLELVEHKKIDKKVKLLYRWISKINPDTPDFQELFKIELLPTMMDSLINIEQSFFLMSSITLFEPISTLAKSPAELKFFSLKEVVPPKKQEIIAEKTVEDILAPITENPKQKDSNLPAPSKEDWLQQDNAPLNLKNIPKPTDDADWLQDF
jgi:hypothetical protein